MNTNTRTVQQRFADIAAAYDEHAAVQREVGKRLLERLDGLNFQPANILDLGCATGHQARALYERYPGARIIAMDFATAMLKHARRQRGRWKRRFELVSGDAEALPLATGSLDLVYASMTLEWSRDLATALSVLRRVIKPGGLLLMATTGPDTLIELRQALAGHCADLDTGGTIDAQRLGDALVRAGFQEPVVDTDWLTTTHGHPTGLLEDLENTGATVPTNLDHDTLSASYQGRGGSRQSYPATWEIVYASAWAPEEGQPIRTGIGEEASVSVANLKVRRR